MKEIYIKPNEVLTMSEKVRSMAGKASSIGKSVKSIMNSLDWEISAKGTIDRSADSISSRVDKLAEQANMLGETSRKAAEEFRNVDSTLAKDRRNLNYTLKDLSKSVAVLNSADTSKMKPQGNGIKDFFKKVGDWFKGLKERITKPFEAAGAYILKEIVDFLKGLSNSSKVHKPDTADVTPPKRPEGATAVPPDKPDAVPEAIPKPPDKVNSFVPPSNYTNPQKAQYYLDKMGFDIGTDKAGNPLIDGDIGTKSSSAIIMFQYSQGLPVTGVADVATLKKLDECANNGTTYDLLTSVFDTWKPGQPTISRELEKNGFLAKENMVRLPTTGGGSGYAEKEAAIAWAMMVNDAMEYNKTADKKLNISNFALKGSNSGYRAYNEQVEAYADWKYLGGNLTADVGKYWDNPVKANQWLEENRKNFGKNGHWNNIPDSVTAPGGPLAGHGASNHGWGLALDMSVGSSEHSSAETLEGQWLEKNAGNYGFKGLVEGKNSSGKTIYKETWHWDYMKP